MGARKLIARGLLALAALVCLLPLASCATSTDTLPHGVGLHASPLVLLNGHSRLEWTASPSVFTHPTPMPAKPTWRTWPTTSAPRYTVLRWQWFGGVAASFVSGGAWGFHEKTMHHWWVFAERFPNADPDFFNPAISWRNKYIDGDPAKGRNDTPVLLSDAKHLLASTALAGGFVAGATFTIGEQRPWWQVCADLAAGAVAWRLGNWIAFDGLYR